MSLLLSPPLMESDNYSGNSNLIKIMLIKIFKDLGNFEKVENLNPTCFILPINNVFSKYYFLNLCISVAFSIFKGILKNPRT